MLSLKRLQSETITTADIADTMYLAHPEASINRSCKNNRYSLVML